MITIDYSLKGKCGVYVIMNTVNGNRYIGSSKDIYNRLHEHLHNLKFGISHNKHLQSAWDKYTEESFICGVLEMCSEEAQFEREQFYLTTMRPEYNLTYNVVANSGVSPSDETRTKISNTLKEGYQSGRIKEMGSLYTRIPVYVYNIRTWELVKECVSTHEAFKFVGSSCSGERDFTTRIYSGTYILSKVKFTSLTSLKNYVIPNYLYYKSNTAGKRRFLIGVINGEVKYFDTLKALADASNSSRSTLSKHTDATIDNPYTIKASNTLMYFCDKYQPLPEGTQDSSSDNIGERMIENPEINSEIKESESSYSVEGEPYDCYDIDTLESKSCH